MAEPRPGSARILIVDDEPSVRRFAARVLMEAGYRVEEAADGIEAMDIVGSAMIDVIVSDVVMPRMNGVELVRALAESQQPVPVILMSGYAVVELQGMGIAAPCGILAKPFSGERLVEEVRRCLAPAA